MYFNTFKTGTVAVDELIDTIGAEFALLRGPMAPRPHWQADTVSKGDEHILAVDYSDDDHFARIKVKFTAPESRKLSPPPADVSAVQISIDGAVVFDWFFDSDDILSNISCDAGTVIAKLTQVLEETDLELTVAETSKRAVVDVASLFSDMQANALRILDLIVQRNGRKPLARKLDIEESELWTSLTDGMYWYDEPTTGAVYYAVLFVLPATHPVVASHPESDRLAFFFKQEGRSLTLAEIRVNGEDISNGSGSFETWALEHDAVVMSFYERSEQVRAETEEASPRPDAKPVIVTIQSDSLQNVAVVTALLRHAINLRDSRMIPAARDAEIQKGRHGMVIKVPSELIPMFNEAYRVQDDVALDQSVVDMRPLLLEIRVQ